MIRIYHKYKFKKSDDLIFLKLNVVLILNTISKVVLEFIIYKMSKNIFCWKSYVGVGGICLGFENSGFKLEWANEYDKNA